MALKNIDTYIERHGLVETTDATVNKPIYRKPGFDGIVSLSAMEENFSRFLRRKRDAQRLNRQQVGTMVGIHHEIYARHERAAARLTMTREGLETVADPDDAPIVKNGRGYLPSPCLHCHGMRYVTIAQAASNEVH